MDKEKILKELSLYDKASLLVGYTNMTTRPIEEFDIPSLVMSDGPNGVRKENDDKSIEGSIKTLKATCFPCGSALAQSFDDELIYEVGKQIALECKYYGINALLGPAINIKRNPLCGRNFEYLSEDPYHSGKMGASFVKGVQSENVISCVKHFACNNLEKWRYVGDSIVDERALNEIYLKSFEIAVKEAKPGMVMTAYNQVNGQFASENTYTLKDTLIGKWGYQGLTVTDWGGMVHRDISLNAGQDLEMPGMVKENIQKIVDGVNSGLIEMATLDNAVSHLLDAIERTKDNERIDESVFEASKEVALKAAMKSAVLLKNKDNVLPLDKNKKLVVIGDLFTQMRFQGSGSALINARETFDNVKAFEEENIDYVFERGYDQNKTAVNPALETKAIRACKDIKTIVFFGGLTDLSESEGYDRKDMKLEKNQRHLLRELAKLNKNLICIFYGGSPFEIPSYEKIDGILYMNLPGQMGGLALTNLLFGKVSPSGRTSQTWPISYEDIPFSNEYASNPLELYKESIYVGYRYFVTAKKEVRFPFGYGLSYGETHSSNFDIQYKSGAVQVSFDIENLSDIDLEETIQVYVGMPHSNVARPEKELKKYLKIKLGSKEQKHVSCDIPLSDLMIFDNSKKEFVTEKGEYIIYISKNANDDLYKKMIEIHGEEVEKCEKSSKYLQIADFLANSREDFEEFIGRKIPKYVAGKRPYTMETPICEYRSFFGRIIRKEMLKVGDKVIKSAKKIEDEQERQRTIKSGTFIKMMISQNCLRSILFSSGGLVDTKKAEGILDIANGKVIRGFKKMK